MHHPLDVQLGHYRTEHFLGRGGMAEVWQGKHCLDGQPIAIKIITSPDKLLENASTAMLEEIRSVARLSHRGIVQVFDCGRVGAEVEEATEGRIKRGSFYLVMELAETTLQRAAVNPAKWPEVREVIVTLLEALSHSHARGVIHRDLKPENVLVMGPDASAPYKLTDFGLAHIYRERSRPGLREYRAYGTPQFMAPEQVRGLWREQGPWTDLYSLGCLIYWLIRGQGPFEGGSPEEIFLGQLRGRALPLRVAPGFPVDFPLWVAGLLVKNSTLRYQFAADALRDLLSLEVKEQEGPWASTLGDEETLSYLARQFPSQINTFAPRWVSEEPVQGPTRAGLGLFGLRSPELVGREKEKASLWAGLCSTFQSKRPGVAVLTGLVGVGASRLAQWLGEEAHQAGAALVLRAYHEEIATPATGLGRMFSNFLAIRGLNQSEIEEHLKKVRKSSGEELLSSSDCEMLAKVLASAADPDFVSPPERLGYSQREIFELYYRLLLFVTRVRPALLILDDLHWSEESLAFLSFLLKEGAGASIFIVATVAEEVLMEQSEVEERLSNFIDLEDVQLFPVPALTQREHRDLVGRILGLQEKLRDKVVEKTAGNPLFAIQLVGDWVQRGLLRSGEQGFELKDDQTPGLPDDIHFLLQRRISLYLRESKPGFESRREALEIAAALGMNVENKIWWQAIEKVQAEHEEILGPLFEAQMLTTEPYGFRFAHGALRESIERISREAGRWVRINESCALALRATYGDQDGMTAQRVGHHLLEAQRLEESASALLVAARYAGERTRLRESHELFRLYFEVLHRLKISLCDPSMIQGFLEECKVYIREEKFEEAQSCLAQAKVGLKTNADQEHHGEFYYLSAVVTHLLGDPLRGRDLVTKAIRYFESSRNDEGLGRSYYLLGEILNWRGRRREALPYYLKAKAFFQKGGTKRGLAKCNLALGYELANQGSFKEGQALLMEGITAYRDLGESYAVGVGLSNLGTIYRKNGEMQRAREIYEEGLEIHSRAGVREISLYLNYCCVLMEVRDFTLLEEILKELMERALSQQRQGFIGILEAKSLPVHSAMGRWEEWEKSLLRSRTFLEEGGIYEADLARTYEIAAEVASEMGREREAFQASALATWQRNALET